MTGFRVDWCSGPNAQIELSQAGRNKGLAFKYTPRFRATLRPPAESIPLQASYLKTATQQLKRLTQSAAPARRDIASSPGTVSPSGIEDDIRALGGALYDLVIPEAAQADLRPDNSFLDFGIDERMLHFPWELMHDGEQYICLKHAFGRFVAAAGVSPVPATSANWLTETLDEISILVISVPTPRDRGRARYEPLAAAAAEAATIERTVRALPNMKVEVLADALASAANVTGVLRERKFQIVHFCGHANYDLRDPMNSSLVLWDEDFPAGAIQRLVRRAQPVICVVNACDTARVSDERALNVYSLARAFIETGAYLVGSRWALGDAAAANFAAAFYASLLGSCQPLGEAMRAGRKAARETPSSDRLDWGAYVLYGDPRLYFRRL